MEAGSFWDTVIGGDKALFLWLNGHHTAWLDPLMKGLSSYWFFGLFGAVVFAAMLLRGGKRGGYGVLCLLLSLGVNSALTNLVKVIVARPRPIHDALVAPLAHTLEKYDASYSFFSAHSSNVFCLAVFAFLWFRNRMYGYLLLGCAAAVAYSRIYVAKHYPLDVLCGMLFGCLMGWAGYRICRRVTKIG